MQQLLDKPGPFEAAVNLGLVTEALPMTTGDTRRLRDVVTQVAGQSGVIPEPDESITDLTNRLIAAYRKGRHTPESWKLMGKFLTHLRKVGVDWDKSLMPIATRKAMGLKEREEVRAVSANEFEALSNGKVMGRFWQAESGLWTVQFGNETADYSDRGQAQEHAFGRPSMAQSGPSVGAGFGFVESFEFGEKVETAAKEALAAVKRRAGLALSDAVHLAARKHSTSESAVWKVVQQLKRSARPQLAFEQQVNELCEANEWSAVARDGIIVAMKGDEEIGFTSLGSDGKPGTVSWLANPNDADKEHARNAIDNWQDFQRPNQNGTVDAADGVDESLNEIQFRTELSGDEELVQLVGRNWNAVRSPGDLRTRLSAAADRLDELGDRSLATTWRQKLGNMPGRMSKSAINTVLFSAWAQLKKAGHVTDDLGESLEERFTDFEIEKVFDEEAEFGTWEYRVGVTEAAFAQLDKAREPAGIVLNDVDEHRGKTKVYFVVEGSNEADARRKLEGYLKKVVGTQLSMF